MIVDDVNRLRIDNGINWIPTSPQSPTSAAGQTDPGYGADQPHPDTVTVTPEKAWWYTVKSIGLALTLAALTYQLGKKAGRS